MTEARPSGRNRGLLVALAIALAPVLLFGFGRAMLRALAYPEDPGEPALRGPIGVRAAAPQPPPPQPAPRDPAEAAVQKWSLPEPTESANRLRQVAARFAIEPEQVASQGVYTTLVCHTEHPAVMKRSDDGALMLAALRFVEKATRGKTGLDQSAFVSAYEEYVAAGCPPP